jgi:hypothetical protein
VLVGEKELGDGGGGGGFERPGPPGAGEVDVEDATILVVVPSPGVQVGELVPEIQGFHI